MNNNPCSTMNVTDSISKTPFPTMIDSKPFHGEFPTHRDMPSYPQFEYILFALALGVSLVASSLSTLNLYTTDKSVLYYLFVLSCPIEIQDH